MSRLIGVAAVQMSAVPNNIPATLDKLESLVGQITRTLPWVDMLCFPECILTALAAYTPPTSKPSGEPIPGPTTSRLCSLAERHQKWLIPGTMNELEGDNVYNTAIAISPQGEIVARYRKIFPWRPGETCQAGDACVVFDVPGVGRFGLCICYDLWFPEISRTLAWMGAEVILQSSFTATSDRPLELVLIQANAIFNQCYYIGINAAGEYGCGASLFVDPNGRVLQKGGQNDCVLTELLDLDQVSTAREVGTLGLNQLWKSLRDDPAAFAPYTQGMAASPMVKSLGPLVYPPTFLPKEMKK